MRTVRTYVWDSVGSGREMCQLGQFRVILLYLHETNTGPTRPAMSTAGHHATIHEQYQDVIQVTLIGGVSVYVGGGLHIGFQFARQHDDTYVYSPQDAEMNSTSVIGAAPTNTQYLPPPQTTRAVRWQSFSRNSKVRLVGRGCGPDELVG